MKNALNKQKKQRDEKRAKDKKIVDRWIYVNNIPDGSIPFIASGADGRGFNDLRGLIPGALGNLGALNPVQLFNGFTAGTYPDCAEISLQTVNNENVKQTETRHVALVEMVEINPCSFYGNYNPASGKSGKNCPESFNAINSGSGSGGTGSGVQTNDNKEKKVDIYTQQYSLVSKDGESIGLYEMGSLAGSSGVAYQTTHRSPLSYNIAKSSSMTTGLTFGKFGRNLPQDEIANAQEVMENHNANVGSFYKDPISSSGVGVADTTETQEPSLYDELIQRLARLMEPRGVSEGREEEDKSDIRGEPLSQIYYYGITAIMLYLLYKMLYKNNRKL